MYFSWFDIRLEVAGAFVVWLATMFSIMERDRLNGAMVGFMISHALDVSSFYDIDQVLIIKQVIDWLQSLKHFFLLCRSIYL